MMKFQIPPITTQEETVRVLDKFDKLVNSISKGLPVEIMTGSERER